jgi:ABC-2 type transport system permease protein
MNILKRELRAGLKPFILWTIGLFVLVFAGMMKYSGIGDSKDVLLLFVKVPRVILAVIGMADVDISTIGGYYAVLFFYAMICASIYAVHLGSNAVLRESVDKTYEFVFTKPRSRSHILPMKLIAGWIYLLVFCVLNDVFSMMAVSYLGFSKDISTQVVLFSTALFVVGSVFLSLAALIAALSRQAERGSRSGNLAFLIAFLVGVIYDMLENGGILKTVFSTQVFQPGRSAEQGFRPAVYGDQHRIDCPVSCRCLPVVQPERYDGEIKKIHPVRGVFSVLISIRNYLSLEKQSLQYTGRSSLG